MEPQTKPNILEIPNHFDFPFEVILFICCLFHMVIGLLDCLAITLKIVHDSTTPMRELVDSIAALLAVLNPLFSIFTFFAAIFVANVTDQQRWGMALSMYTASSRFLAIETFMIVPYVLYRTETARRWGIKYQ